MDVLAGAAVAAWLASLALILPAATRRLREQRARGPLVALVFMIVLWSLPVPELPGLPLHLLGVTAAALIAGPAVAYLQVAVLALASGLPVEAGWTGTALYGLAAGGLPALVTMLLLGFARRLAPNVFLFIFLNAFLAAALGMTAYVVARELLLADAASGRRLLELALLLPLPEALVTGLLIAPLVAFRSELVLCFDADRHYGRGIR